MSMTRQLRRAAEREALKAARRATDTMPAPAPASTATPAQIAANRANAQLSTGPTTEIGKSTVGRNRLLHGLAGKFRVLDWENATQFTQMLADLTKEYQPSDATEQRLLDSIAQHYWLMQRAIFLQDDLLCDPDLDEKRFSLYLRYQTTNERAYYKAMKEMQTHKKEKAKQQIGFESQKAKQEAQEARTRLTQAKADYTEMENEIRHTMQAPLPGHTRIPFEDLTAALRSTLRDLNANLEAKLAEKAAA